MVESTREPDDKFRAVEVEDLIDEVHPLRDAELAFNRAFGPDGLKIQLAPEGLPRIRRYSAWG